jgi:hypothetical protein
MSTHSLRLFSRNPGLAAQRSRLSDGGEAARPGGGQKVLTDEEKEFSFIAIP